MGDDVTMQVPMSLMFVTEFYAAPKNIQDDLDDAREWRGNDSYAKFDVFSEDMEYVDDGCDLRDCRLNKYFRSLGAEEGEILVLKSW